VVLVQVALEGFFMRKVSNAIRTFERVGAFVSLQVDRQQARPPEGLQAEAAIVLFALFHLLKLKSFAYLSGIQQSFHKNWLSDYLFRPLIHQQQGDILDNLFIIIRNLN
jgi:hypothetical protein